MIAFVTTCKNRTQHLEKTLPKNLEDNADFPDCKFIILDYGSRDHLRQYLFSRHAQAIAKGRVVVYSYQWLDPFRMAHAKNMAHRLGILEGADILVNLDADNYTCPGFAKYIAQQFAQKKNIFLWAKMVQGVLPRGISGRIVVTSQAFLKAGGYDEKHDTWGPDDKNFNHRLRMLGYEAVEIAPHYIDAVRHNDKMRFKEYPHITKGDYDLDHSHMPEPDCAVANFGNFGCGVVYRNQSPNPIRLDPLPTRIFGIGMHKTGTTSLHHALEILGFDSAHWNSAHWAKRIWREMNQQGRSPTLEKHYALSDFPITTLFKKLDAGYPGSKFILTLRKEQKWLESVRNHWDATKNPFRSGWDNDPFTNIIHKKVYGKTTFDPYVMIHRYRNHHWDVVEYFENRPSDLLIMNIDEGAGWKELCAFLNVPIPNVPYPKKFVTQKPERKWKPNLYWIFTVSAMILLAAVTLYLLFRKG